MDAYEQIKNRQMRVNEAEEEKGEHSMKDVMHCSSNSIGFKK
jgi:hypothetical protein